MEESIRWNYTTWLNIGFLILCVPLVVRFFKTGGPEMLRMMEEHAPAAGAGEHGAHCGHGGHDAHAGHKH
jgi:hypothetical protein